MEDFNGMLMKINVIKKRVTQKSFCKENNPCQKMLWQGLLVLKVGFWVSPFLCINTIAEFYFTRIFLLSTMFIPFWVLFRRLPAMS